MNERREDEKLPFGPHTHIDRVQFGFSAPNPCHHLHAGVAAPPAPIVFASPNFIFQGEDPSRPIVAHSPSPQFDHLYINPGALIFHEGQFHMFSNSFTQWPGKVMVGYMRSDDGYHWDLVQDEPVFVTDQVPFGDGKADVSRWRPDIW